MAAESDSTEENSSTCEAKSVCGGSIYQHSMYKLPVILAVAVMILYTALHHYQIFSFQDLYYKDYDRQQFMTIINITAEVAGTVIICFAAVLIISKVTLTACLLVGCLVCVVRLVTVLDSQTLWLNIITSLLLGMGKSLLMVIITAKVTSIGQKLSGLTSTKSKIIHQKLFAIFYGLYQLSMVFSGAFNFAFPSDNVADLSNITHHISHTTMGYCEGTPSCLHLVPGNFTSNKTTPEINNAHNIDETTMSHLIIYLFLGLTFAVIIACTSESINSPTNDDLTTKSFIPMLKDWKFAFIIPFMTFSGMVEGYIFLDHILVYVHCYGYGAHKVMVLICYGIVGSFVSTILLTTSHYINRVHRLTFTSLLQVAVIILLIACPPRIRHPSVFYITMSMLAVCVTLWRTQISVLVGILEPKRKIQAYSALQMFHGIGYLLSGCVSTYLCMNTKLYILLASVILAQFLYLMNELKLRILKISQQRGGVRKNTPSVQISLNVRDDQDRINTLTPSSIPKSFRKNNSYNRRKYSNEHRPSLEPMIEITPPTETEVLVTSSSETEQLS